MAKALWHTRGSKKEELWNAIEQNCVGVGWSLFVSGIILREIIHFWLLRISGGSKMIAPSSQRSFHRLNITTLFHRWKCIFSLVCIQLLIAVWTDLNTACELTFLFWHMLRFTSYIYIMLLNWAKQWESIWCWSFSSQIIEIVIKNEN